MVRKRRRARYTWMPTLGGLSAGAGEDYNTSYFTSGIQVNSPNLGPTDLYVTPIVPDYTQWVLTAGSTNAEPSLRDQTEGQDWFLKRIVGKIHITAGQATFAAGVSPAILKVCAAFFVGRADDTNENVPDSNNVEIDPFNVQNVRQPWIWRRNWVLMNGLTAQPAGFSDIMEVNNQGFSVADGPHIDAKTARRIRREERLWFVLNAYGYDNMDAFTSGYATPGRIRFNLDYRVLGQMRRSTNRSTF